MEFTGEKFIPSDELSVKEIGIEHLHRYHSIISLIKDKTVLDIACGEGYGSALMAQTAKRVCGVDIDPEAIAHASATYQPKNEGVLNFLQGSVEQIPLADQLFDVVISFETIEHVDDIAQQKFMDEVKRVLKPEGILIISTPDKVNYSDRHRYKNEFHVREFTRAEFQEFLKKNFTHIRQFDQGYDIVSAITETDPLKVKQLSVCDWERTLQPFSRKYLIAIASNRKIADRLTLDSVVFQVDRDYQETMDHIVEMEDRILELGAWGKKLDAEIAQSENKIREDHDVIEKQSSVIDEQSSAIEKQSSAIEEQSSAIEELSVLNEKLNARVSDLQTLVSEDIEHAAELVTTITESLKKISELHLSVGEKDKMIGDLDHQIQAITNSYTKEIEHKNALVGNQSAVIDQLKDKSIALNKELTHLADEITDKDNAIQELNNKISHLHQQKDVLTDEIAEIYASEGWKLLSKYYWIRNRILPEKSSRYRVVKKFVNKLRGKNKTQAYVNIPFQNKNTALIPQTNDPSSEKEEIKIYLPIEFPVFTSPKVSIIIPVYNGWEMNYKCLNSINKNTQGVSYEVIVADDNSTDETRNIGQYIKNIVHIRNDQNLGFLKNCNHAASFAKGEYIHFLNNDTEVTPNWLRPLANLMEKDPSIGITGSKLVYPDGRLQEAGGILWSDASGWNYGNKQDPSAPEFNYVKEVDYISGASVMIRKDLWNELGGFDTIYTPAYCEDSDIAFRARRLGFKTIYQPLSEVTHYEGYSHGTDTSEKQSGSNIKAYQEINNRKFFERWKDILQTQHLPNGEDVFRARDRSIHKKTILVIDHYVPHFDKDAGSKTTYQYLELFLALGLNVKFLGDNFYRHEPYTTMLQQMGIEVLYGSWYRDNWQQWLTANGNRIDYIYINRPHISIKYIDFLKENTRATILYYGHDLHFWRELKQYEVEKTPELLVSSGKWKAIETYLFEKSDIILTPSAEENELISALNNNYKVETILPYFYKDRSLPITDFNDRKDILFVGGFGHAPNVDSVLWFNSEIWPLVRKSLPGVRFIIVGSHAPGSIQKLDGDDILVKGYVSENELQTLYSQVKLSVIPLRYGAGVKGKTIEAMHHALPLVSTKFGIEGISGNGTSFLKAFDSSENFANEIIRLYSNNAELEMTSRQEADYINDFFTQKTAAQKMSAILKIEMPDSFK